MKISDEYLWFSFSGEEQVAALTAGKRVPWAEARTKYFQAGTNARSLKTIESAAFAVSLDDEEATMGSSGSSLGISELDRVRSVFSPTKSDVLFNVLF